MCIIDHLLKDNSINFKNLTIISPDAGGVARAKKF